MFLFRQARLSHYGGGKSSLTEVGALLVPPVPFLGSELVKNSPPLISDHHFVLCFFRQRLVYSIPNTFSFLPGFIAWMDVLFIPC